MNNTTTNAAAIEAANAYNAARSLVVRARAMIGGDLVAWTYGLNHDHDMAALADGARRMLNDAEAAIVMPMPADHRDVAELARTIDRAQRMLRMLADHRRVPNHARADHVASMMAEAVGLVRKAAAKKMGVALG